MVIDTRTSPILPKKGALLKINQVCTLLYMNRTLKKKKTLKTCINSHLFLSLQELAGYTGGDARFLKEDFEIQLNKRLFWDSVRSKSTASKYSLVCTLFRFEAFKCWLISSL